MFGNGAAITSKPYQGFAEGESARAAKWHETRLSRRQLEIAFRQFADDDAKCERPELFLQRSGISGGVRV